MNLEGRIIGNRYEMIEKIGNGGMATVYKAKDMTLKRYVAVKVSSCCITCTAKHCIHL